MTDFERVLYDAGWRVEVYDGAVSWVGRVYDVPDCDLPSAFAAALVALYERGKRDAMRPTPIADGLPEPGIAVLALVRTTNNSGSSWRRWLRGIYAAERTLEALTEDCDIDYDADEGVAYCNPGWYESNEFEDVHWRIHDDVLAWMPLPPTNFGEGEQ